MENKKSLIDDKINSNYLNNLHKELREINKAQKKSEIELLKRREKLEGKIILY